MGNLIPGVGLVGGVMDEVANHLDPQVRQSNLQEELDKRGFLSEEEFRDRQSHLQDEVVKMVREGFREEFREFERKMSVPSMGSPMAIPTAVADTSAIQASLLASSLPPYPMPPIQHSVAAPPPLMLTQQSITALPTHMQHFTVASHPAVLPVTNGLYQMHHPLAPMVSNEFWLQKNGAAAAAQRPVGQPSVAPEVASPGPKKPLRRLYSPVPLPPAHQEHLQHQFPGNQEQQQHSAKLNEQQHPAKPEQLWQPANLKEEQEKQHPAKQEQQQKPTKQDDQQQLPPKQVQEHEPAIQTEKQQIQANQEHQQQPPKQEDPRTAGTTINSNGEPQQWSTTDKVTSIQLSQNNMRALKKGYGSGSVRSTHPIPASGQGRNST